MRRFWNMLYYLNEVIAGRAAVVPVLCPEGKKFGELIQVTYIADNFHQTQLLLSTVRLDKSCNFSKHRHA